MSDLLNSRETAAGNTQAIAPGQPCTSEDLETREAVNESTRRRFFQMALRGTLAGLVTATGIEFADPRPVMAQSKLSPDAALQDLIEGNRRFSAHRVTAH
jgi:carbonic anhydrase